MTRQIDGLALGTIAAGSLLTYAGIKGYSVPHAIQALIKGQPPSTGGQVNPITGTTFPPATSTTGGAGGGSAPAAPANVSGNVAKGKLMAAAYGWGTGAQWNALYALWQKESGWDSLMRNPGSGAFGIAQALGHGTASSGAVVPLVHYPGGGTGRNVTVNEYPSHAANAGSAVSQISWGLSYIKSRWGSPEVAWGGYSQRGSWY